MRRHLCHEYGQLPGRHPAGHRHHGELPAGPGSAGSNVVFGGSVTNTGNITLMNVMVFSTQSSNSTPVLGPITLAPGASAPFMGSYLATGGSNPTTNSMI